jgi:hypothetical protein
MSSNIMEATGILHHAAHIHSPCDTAALTRLVDSIFEGMGRLVSLLCQQIYLLPVRLDLYRVVKLL